MLTVYIFWFSLNQADFPQYGMLSLVMYPQCHVFLCLLLSFSSVNTRLKLVTTSLHTMLTSSKTIFKNSFLHFLHLSVFSCFYFALWTKWIGRLWPWSGLCKIMSSALLHIFSRNSKLQFTLKVIDPHDSLQFL